MSSDECIRDKSGGNLAAAEPPIIEPSDGLLGGGDGIEGDIDIASLIKRTMDHQKVKKGGDGSAAKSMCQVDMMGGGTDMLQHGERLFGSVRSLYRLKVAQGRDRG